jgi:hypothetical protein
MQPIFDDVLVSILVDGEFFPVLCATDMSLNTRHHSRHRNLEEEKVKRLI